jgi:hypothetical protein
MEVGGVKQARPKAEGKSGAWIVAIVGGGSH